SLLVYRTGLGLVVRDARTLALRARLTIGPPFTQRLTADVPQGSIVIAPDRRTVSYAYWLMSAGGRPTTAYLARWALPSGRRLATVPLGQGPLLALRLLDAGARLTVVTGRAVRTYDAGTLAPLRSVPVRPAPLLPAAAAVSPDGATVAVGAQNGAVSFVASATGRA